MVTGMVKVRDGPAALLDVHFLQVLPIRYIDLCASVGVLLAKRDV
jgi:hypothetical protein